MQPAKDRIGMDGIRFSAAMARIGNREDEGTDRRIGNTGTQQHWITQDIRLSAGMAFPVAEPMFERKLV